MFQGWRIQVREAEAAYEQGRLEDARRLLEQGELQQYLPGKRLAVRVAQGMAQRAVKLALAGDGVSAWQHWESARRLGGDTEELLAARQELIELELHEAENQLRDEDAAGALARLERVERHQPCDASRRVKEVAQRIQSARVLSRRGRFADAEAQLNTAAKLRPDLEPLARLSRECHENLQRHRELTEQLHRAVADSKWSDALALADQVLELAPEHRVAQDVRKRAWAQVGTRLVDSGRLAQTQAWSPSRLAAADDSKQRRHDDTDAARGSSGPRFFLWVDAVGGYLVCLSPSVVLGQAAPNNHVDIPILGDLSRRHARILREGEGYMLEAWQPVQIGRRAVHEKALLRDGDELELGEGVRLRFRQPHALSASARLEFLSRHRTQPSADAVILMAESCVLGKSWQDHIVCRDWSGDVVMYRRDGQLYCRASEPIEIDGKFCDGRGEITCNSHITGSDFSMSLEDLDKCKSQPLP